MISYNNMDDDWMINIRQHQTRRGMSRGDFRMEKCRLGYGEREGEGEGEGKRELE